MTNDSIGALKVGKRKFGSKSIPTKVVASAIPTHDVVTPISLNVVLNICLPAKAVVSIGELVVVMYRCILKGEANTARITLHPVTPCELVC